MQFNEKFENYQQLVTKYLGTDHPEIETFVGQQQGYRLRAEFGVWHENEPTYVMHHTLVDQQTKQKIWCDDGFAIACPLINHLMPLVQDFMTTHQELAFKLFQVEYLTSMSNQAIISLLYHRKLEEEQAQHIGTLLQAHINAHATQIGLAGEVNIILRSRKRNFVIGQHFIQESLVVNGKPHQLFQAENSFSQPNGEINNLMLSYVEQHTHTAKDILELYCGVGNFTMVLARCGRRVLATEVNKQSINFAYKNLEINQIDNVDLGRISAEEFVQAMNGERPFRRLAHLDLTSYDFDTVFVDPPRSGLDHHSLDMISAYPHIIYVSCNPETLMPNLNYLRIRHGFDIKHLAVFDQFPQTPHIESIAILIKNQYNFKN